MTGFSIHEYWICPNENVEKSHSAWWK